MRFYWLRDRENQKQFYIYWKPGRDSISDYFTKHHPTPHHKAIRKIYMSSCLIGTIDFAKKNLIFSPCEGVLI